MVTLLRKMFIKDYQNIHKKEVRDAHGKLAAFFGIFSNFFLCGIKLFAGIISGSISIIADSMNNLADMGSSLITLVGFKLSAKPADDEHPYGHERIEYIVGIIISVIILVVGGQFFYQSLMKIIHKSNVDIGIISLIILGVSIFVKLYQSLVNHKLGKLIDSPSLIATAVDSRNDCITTFFVLVGCLINRFLGYNLDGYFGILVSIFIVISGIGLIKDSASPLIGVGLKKEELDKIISDIKGYKIVLGIHDVVCHLYGPTKTFMSLHAEVPSNESIMNIHDQIDIIEQTISRRYNIDLVIHMDPIENTNEEVMNLQKIFVEALASIDEELSLHDFRIVKRPNSYNVIFDVLTPRDLKLNHNEITSALKEKVKDKGKFNLVIHYECGYI